MSAVAALLFLLVVEVAVGFAYVGYEITRIRKLAEPSRPLWLDEQIGYPADGLVRAGETVTFPVATGDWPYPMTPRPSDPDYDPEEEE